MQKKCYQKLEQYIQKYSQLKNNLLYQRLGALLDMQLLHAKTHTKLRQMTSNNHNCPTVDDAEDAPPKCNKSCRVESDQSIQELRTKKSTDECNELSSMN